jgi:hypothetical protein
MKLHHLRTAFLVICLLLVCSQGRSGIVGGDILGDPGDPSEVTPPVIDSGYDSGYDSGSYDTIINNTDPAVPEPTTLSLLAMSLLLAARRWR